ncbi:hypothetical protein B4U80_07062, partial [Leptotrombidium deliense]
MLQYDIIEESSSDWCSRYLLLINLENLDD